MFYHRVGNAKYTQACVQRYNGIIKGTHNKSRPMDNAMARTVMYYGISSMHRVYMQLCTFTTFIHALSLRFNGLLVVR